jgi:hypothetical protein
VLGSQVFSGGADGPGWAALCTPWDATASTRSYGVPTLVTALAAWGEAGGRQLLAVGTQGTDADELGTIVIFDPASGKRLALLRGHLPSVNLTSQGLPVDQAPPEVFALAFSRDGRWLISGGVAGDVIVWDVESWTRLHESRPTDGLIRDIALHPTRAEIAIATDLGRSVQVLRLPGLEVEGKLETRELGFACGVRFSRDGRYLFAVSGEGRLHTARRGGMAVYELDPLRLLEKRAYSDRAMSSIDLSPDGRRLVTYAWGQGSAGILEVREIDVPPGD